MEKINQLTERRNIQRKSRRNLKHPLKLRRRTSAQLRQLGETIKKRTNKRLNEHYTFLNAAIAIHERWKGNYLQLKGKDQKRLIESLQRSGAKQEEHIIFSSVVTRIYPEHFFRFYKEPKRIIVITTKAIYELDIIGPLRVRRCITKRFGVQKLMRRMHVFLFVLHNLDTATTFLTEICSWKGPEIKGGSTASPN